jgi:hypothetical protein
VGKDSVNGIHPGRRPQSATRGPVRARGRAKADPKIGKPEELTFAEKYLAPVLDAIGNAAAQDTGPLGALSRLLGNNGNARGGVVGRAAMGAADPGVAIAQVAANAVGQGDAANQRIADVEKQYQASRGADANSFDPARLGPSSTNSGLWVAQPSPERGSGLRSQ